MRQAGVTGFSGTSAPEDLTLPIPALPVPGFALPTGMTGTLAPAAFSLGPTTSAFGWRQDPFNGAMKFHKGTDIAMPVGQEVPVARAGQVTFAGEQSGYGMTVVVGHGPGLSTRYAHLSEILVAEASRLPKAKPLQYQGLPVV